MKTRRIGSLEVSVVGLGANNFGTDYWGDRCDRDDSVRVIHAALDAGVNLVDTAEEYSIAAEYGTGRSEELIGLGLGSRRDEMVIATKFETHNPNFPEQRGAERIIRAVEGSLERLGTDRIDLYQQHWPDPETPTEEVLEALDRLVRDGKVREIGCSNYSGQMIDDAQAISSANGYASFVSSQSQYNVLELPRQEGVLDACERHGMSLLPFFPLASGLLTGKYRKGQPPPSDSRLAADTPINRSMRDAMLSDDRHDKVARLDAFARERGHTLLELAISWLTSQPMVASVIAGATRPEQVVANAAAACWDLTPEDFAAVSEIVASEGPRKR